MTFLVHLNLQNLISRKNRSSGKIIIFQQSQALTSHLESFWSIVHSVVHIRKKPYQLHEFFLAKPFAKSPFEYFANIPEWQYILFDLQNGDRQTHQKTRKKFDWR